MYDSVEREAIQERPAWKINGFIGLLIILVLLIIAFSIRGAVGFLMMPVAIVLFVLFLSGLVILQPNRAAVITFFGKYIGVIQKSGIWMTIPFANAKRVSLRVSNFNSDKLKVNDANGNPIEIAAVVVYRVVDPARAVLDVNNYIEFVEIQSETSLRHVAAQYPYDNFEDENCTCLRRNGDEVSQKLLTELQERLAIAGVEIIEARLSHLAYATEIASAMLQRQQASAILAARQIIVDGAVGMAQMAIDKLESDMNVTLDKQQKMSMMNNLMVSIITDKSSQPVINIGEAH